MRRFRVELKEWSKGTMTADATADKVPINATPRARNVAFLKGGFPAKRKGCSLYTPTAQLGKNPILGLGTALGFNWVIDSAGRWSKVSASGTFSPIDASRPAPFTPGTHYPVAAVAKNLLFVCNGVDAKKTNGTTVSAWGFAPPAAPTLTDAGTGGSLSGGTYLIALTAYNANTGHESSLSASSTITVAAGHGIGVTWTFPSDPQITTVRVHLFKQGLSSRFFRISSANVSPAPDANGGYPSSITSIAINATDTDITNYTVVSPTTTSNNPPPPNISFALFHGGRMFVTDGNYLYWSQLDDPESFDPTNYAVINTNDDQTIVGFAHVSDYQMIIWKTQSTHALTGPNDPNVWDISVLDPTVGLTSVRAFAYTEGAIWWEALQGLFRVDFSGATVGKPVRTDSPYITDRLENVNEALLGTTTAAYDAIHQRLVFAVPDSTSTSRNTQLLPYNTKLKVFEDIWDPMDVSALGIFSLNGVPSVMIGGYQGRLFQVWGTAYLDGVRQTDGASTTFTLSGTVTSATATTLTDATATFDTAGDGLAEIPVNAVSPQGLVQRNIIASNTTTTLTLLNPWAVQPDATWTYYIGNPWFEFDTAHLEPSSATEDGQGFAFYTRAFKHLLARVVSDTTATLDVYTILDGDFSAFATHNVLKVTSGGARWDIDKWDVGKWGAGAVSTAYQSLGVKGRSCGIRVQSRVPGESVTILSLGLHGTEYSPKSK